VSSADQMDFEMLNMSNIEIKVYILEQYVQNLIKSQEKQRKSMFARMGVLEKRLIDVEQENFELKREIWQLKRGNAKNENQTTWAYGKSDTLFVSERIG
jgi:hypothetical protein